MDRRTMLERGGLIVGAGAALSAISPGIARADGNDRTSLEGGWIGTTDAGAGFGKFMAAYMFARGGGMVTSSSIDLSPRALSTPGYGTWTRTGDRQFLMTFDAFVFDQQGNPAGVVESRATAVLDATGDAWSGVFKFEVRAPNGAVVFSGSGTHSATRIRPERV